jgi:hypothetical protein
MKGNIEIRVHTKEFRENGVIVTHAFARADSMSYYMKWEAEAAGPQNNIRHENGDYSGDFCECMYSVIAFYVAL